MLKPAQLYKNKLQEEYMKLWYDQSCIYYHGGSGSSILDLPNDNYNEHHFVSVDKNDNIIGYISYSLDWQAMSIKNIGIISFQKGNLGFIKDIHKAIYDLFEVYHMNRVSWFCYVDNKAINRYRTFIKKHGGRECAYYRQIAKLLDGRLHDAVEFEILAEEFHK